MIHTQPEQLFLKDFFYTRMARTLAPHSHSACPCPTLRVGGPLGALRGLRACGAVQVQESVFEMDKL